MFDRKLTRRQMLKVAGIGSAGAVLAACAPAAAPAPAQQAPAAAEEAPAAEAKPAAEEVIELHCTHSWDSSFWPRQVEFDDNFAKENPGIKVIPENIIWGEYVPKLTTMAAAGQLPDMMYCQFAWAQRFIMDKAVISLQPYLEADKEFWGEEDFNPESLKSYRWANELYFIPYDEGPTGLVFINKDLFDEAGVPYPTKDWTFDDLLETAKKLTRGEGENRVWGYDGIPGMGGDLNTDFLYPWGARFWVDPCETKSEIDSEEAVQSLKFWASFRLEHKVSPTPAEAQTIQGNPFAFGRVAILKCATWCIPWIHASLKANWDTVHYPIGPKGRSCSSMGSGYGITRDTKHRDAAWQYLRSYLSTEGQIFMWASTGRGSPSRWSAWDAWMKSPLAPPSANVAKEMLQEYAKHEILDSPFGREVTDVSQPIWDRALLGEISVEEAVKLIHEAATPVLEKNKEWASMSFPGECA